jgi:hypothetical protein
MIRDASGLQKQRCDPGLLTSDARLRSDGGQLGIPPAVAKSKGRCTRRQQKVLCYT